MELDISIGESNGARVVRVSGDVDLYTSPRLRTAVLREIAKGRGQVAVDLSRVRYMDSSGVATLVEGHRAAGKKRTTFAIVSPSKSVMKVLELTRLNSVFHIRDAP